MIQQELDLKYPKTVEKVRVRYKSHDNTKYLINIKSDFACFTNPLYKVHRRSYFIPTYSAIQGLLRSIYGHPEFNYVIHSMVVMNEPKHTDYSISYKERIENISDIRQNVPLEDVEYVFEVSIQLNKDIDESRCNHNKYWNIFLRRLSGEGTWYKHPYCGMHPYYIKSAKIVEEMPKSNIKGKSSYFMFFGLNDCYDLNKSHKENMKIPKEYYFAQYDMIDGVVDFDSMEIINKKDIV